VSFYVAIFLALLLLVSGALNLLLIVVSAFGTGGSGLGTGVVQEDGVMYELVAVGGDPEARDSVLRIPIEGAIAELGSPLLGAAGGTVSQVRRALRAAEREPSIKAVLVDINSPGGGVTDSDEIWRLIREFKSEHAGTAVVALMGDMAASGGYYVAAACDLIIARPTTITGSIGVIINGYNYGEALHKLGIDTYSIMSDETPYKDMLSPTRPMTAVERAKLKAIVQEMYERFVDIVDRGRPELSAEQVRAAATGEVYSARRAKELGLVDHIESIADTYARIEELVGVDSLRVVEHRRVPTFFDTLFRTAARAPSVDEAVAHLLRTSTGPKLLYFWPGGR
jgi:protease-4